MSTMANLSLLLPKSLIHRLRDLSSETNLTVDEIAQQALEREIHERVVERIKQVISEEEIKKSVLDRGETVPLEDVSELGIPDVHTCELCARDFSRPLKGIEGPVFCENCIELARGGDFKRIE